MGGGGRCGLEGDVTAGVAKIKFNKISLRKGSRSALRAETTSISSANRSHAERNLEISSHNCCSSDRVINGDVSVIMSNRTISSFSRSFNSSHSNSSFCLICFWMSRRSSSAKRLKNKCGELCGRKEIDRCCYSEKACSLPS